VKVSPAIKDGRIENELYIRKSTIELFSLLIPSDSA
jgi:hypothetical protein